MRRIYHSWSSNPASDRLRTCVFVHARECKLCSSAGTHGCFNIISLCERGSDKSLIKSRRHEEAIWHRGMSEDRLSLLWPNKCFHSIKTIRMFEVHWSGCCYAATLNKLRAARSSQRDSWEKLSREKKVVLENRCALPNRCTLWQESHLWDGGRWRSWEM